MYPFVSNFTAEQQEILKRNNIQETVALYQELARNSSKVILKSNDNTENEDSESMLAEYKKYGLVAPSDLPTIGEGSDTIRTFVIGKDLFNIPNPSPASFIDPNFHRAIESGLLTTDTANQLKATTFANIKEYYGFDIPAESFYDPSTGGYFSSKYACLPVYVYDPEEFVLMDSFYPLRRVLRNWTSLYVGLYVGFLTDGIFPAGKYIGKPYTTNMALISGNYNIVRVNSNWNFPINKEVFESFSDIPAIQVSNPYGMNESIIKFACRNGDLTYRITETNVYRTRPGGVIDEYKRSNGGSPLVLPLYPEP